MTSSGTLRPRLAAPANPIPFATAAASASWPIRDEVLTFHDVVLESGALLPQLRVHYRLEGELTATRDNVVLIVHALTGNVRATDWWKGVVEADGAIDPIRFAVLTANLLGGCDGTTGPSVGDPDALPPITTRDQAVVLARLLDALGVQAPLLICGGSLGGQVTLEFAASYPERVREAVVLAAPAAQTAQGLAWNVIMRRAIALGGARDGLALARMIGMLSYRTPPALERRFGRARSERDTCLVNDWLEAHGDRLVARFDAVSYVALLDAMDAHDVGRGRGGILSALKSVASRVTGVGIPGDLLYPSECVREWTDAIGARFIELPSIHGHDAFLLETARVSAVLREAIERASRSGAEVATTVDIDSHSKQSTGTNASTDRAPRTASSRPVHDSRAVGRRAVQPLRVALAGCGHVGGSVLDLLPERGLTPDQIRIDRILVRDVHRSRPALAHAVARGFASATACTDDSTALLSDEVDVLIEAIGGTTTARTLIETALRRGIRVVTANKALLAERGPQLQRLAREYGAQLDFEGAVAGAIPVVRCVRSGAAGVGVSKVSGILNGTSNFVLDRVAEGQSLSEAIRTAQELGYAEADPTRDLSGEDAEDKLRILAWLIFGTEPSALRVVRRGIDAETAAWAARVAAEGDRVKLLATCSREQGELVARIIPTRVTQDDPWSRVSGPNNRIVVDSASAGTLVFVGAGAGGRATAGAVLSDVLQSTS